MSPPPPAPPSSSMSDLAPLQSLLDSIVGRLCAVEGKVGISSPPRSARTPGEAGAGSAAVAAAAAGADDGAAPHPSLVAHDEHVSRVVIPFAESCDSVGLGENVGPNIRATWAGLRSVVELGTRCRKPPGDVAAALALAPHLKPVRESVTAIRTARLDRRYDWHIKAIVEMMSCASWVVVSPPSQPPPTSFVKEAKGSSEFWSNKIRKEHRGKDDDASKAHIQFCDRMKDLILDLAAYCKEYHLSGLSWNPRGMDLSDAAATAAAAAAPVPALAPAAAAAVETPAKAAPGGGGGMGDIMSELAKKRSADGSSAATGLKRVGRDQQTWREEFKKKGGGAAAAPMPMPMPPPPPPPPPPAAPKPAGPAGATKKGTAAAAAAARGPPVLEYRDRGHKWTVENQTKETAGGKPLTVTVSDPKQQVYVYRCDGVTVKIEGKVKNVVLDGCSKVGVVFGTAISAFEIVNCAKVQVQATGTCPSFSIDKTDGCIIYLSREAVGTTTFVTSKSSEMNVSWEDDEGEIREAPIPEQFQHRLVNGRIASSVSDLYH